MQRGNIYIEIEDFNNDEFNQSLRVDKAIYKDPGDDIISIEDYWHFCKCFALMMGFGPETVDNQFGQE